MDADEFINQILIYVSSEEEIEILSTATSRIRKLPPPVESSEDECFVPPPIKRTKSNDSGEMADRSVQSEDSEVTTEKKRKRTRIACGHCRRAKQKCDNGRPCSRCVSRGRADTCRDAGSLEDLDVFTSSDESEKPFVECFSSEAMIKILDSKLKSLNTDRLRHVLDEQPFKWYDVQYLLNRFLTSYAFQG
jgi:hypothetical protein